MRKLKREESLLLGHPTGRINVFRDANEYADQNGLIGFAVSSSNLSLAVPMEAMWPGVLSASEEAQRWHREKSIFR